MNPSRIQIACRGTLQENVSSVGTNSTMYLQDCDEFNSFDVSRRWRVVGELRLCRCCLNRRHATGVCQNAEECGIERCQLLHHPLLHQNRVQEGHH